MYSKMVLQDQIETLDETKNDGTDSTATTGDSTVSVSGITGNDAAKNVVIVRAPFCSWNGCVHLFWYFRSRWGEDRSNGRIGHCREYGRVELFRLLENAAPRPNRDTG